MKSLNDGAVDRLGRSSCTKIQIWDMPIRAVHWLTVILLPALWWTAHEHALSWHNRLGYALLCLLIFRIYWGFAGSSTARFKAFLRGPSALLEYGRRMFERKAYIGPLGHNPIGGWSVLILLALLALQVALGLFAVDIDGLDSGPLSSFVNFDVGRRLARLHHTVFDILLVFVSLHIAAVLFYLICMKRNLISAMITGSIENREAGGDRAAGLIIVSSPLRTTLGVAIAIVLTWAIISI
jgi:cytochrome b